MQAGPLTTISGTVSQFNYDRDAEVEGFLLSNKTMVHLPRQVAARIADAVHKGDTLQVKGYAQSTPFGMQMVEAQEVQDRSSGKSFTVPQPGAAAPFSGSGHIQQMNYGPDGAINGLLFDNGTLATVPAFSAANPSSIRVGANVAYAGYARTTVSGRTVVDLQTLTINGQALTLGMGGPNGRPGVPPPPPLDRRRTAKAPPAPPANGAVPPAPPAPEAGAIPADRSDQPVPPASPAPPPQL